MSKPIPPLASVIHPSEPPAYRGLHAVYIREVATHLEGAREHGHRLGFTSALSCKVHRSPIELISLYILGQGANRLHSACVGGLSSLS